MSRSEILINERNAVVIDDLDAILKAGSHSDISILYGAGHMEDMDSRLRTDGWAPSRRWFPAISVDLEKSKLSAAEMSMIRTSIKMALSRMAQQAARE